MTSFEVKEQVNRICRLARSFKEMKVLSTNATIESMEINNNMQSDGSSSEQTSIVLLDFEEIDRLKKENEEMKLLLSDYHRGVELLMEAYRNRTINVASDQGLTSTDEIIDPKLVETIVNQGNQISEMRDLMKTYTLNADKGMNIINEHISFLRKENTVLRELYEISTQFGSAGIPIYGNELHMKDKVCQTEEEDEEEEEDVQSNDSESNSDNDDVITVISLKFDESEDDDENKEILKYPGQDIVTNDEKNKPLTESNE